MIEIKLPTILNELPESGTIYIIYPGVQFVLPMGVSFTGDQIEDGKMKITIHQGLS